MPVTIADIGKYAAKSDTPARMPNPVRMG